ncbi:hypothetical protein MMC09_002311 [Bachmanniomyces sp. S44760]|nr:hypothetical protein [Bachmanniomyces sp. S44760]
MSQANGAHTYLGHWVNWSRGAIAGATLTLSERDAGLLTAFLAIFVSASGAAFWRILSYIIHQFRANPEPSDGLHHQQQVVYRNAASPGDAAWEFLRLGFYWRENARRPYRRSWLPTLCASLCFVLFGLAGIFSSQVTKSAGNETLVRSGNCGIWTLDKAGTSQSGFALNSKSLNDTITAAGYARACYGAASNSLECNQYTQQQLDYTTNQNASCPFGDNLCVLGATGAFEMDSELIDSHVHLGINSPPNERVQYRRKATCSPIFTKDYKEIFNNTGEDAKNEITYGDTFQRFHFGPIIDVSNYTYAYNEHTIAEDAGYTLTSLMAISNFSNDVWLVDPVLKQTASDISIFFLAPNGIRFLNAVDDPFYAAHVPDVVPTAGVNITYYQADYYVSAMACIDQHQFCNPLSNKCTSLAGAGVAANESQALAFTDVQSQVAERIVLSLIYTNMYYSVNGRDASALAASSTVYEKQQAPLPNNQWQIEVSAWYSVGLAKLQQLVVQYATGFVAVPGSYIKKPTDSVGIAMCNSQKVRSTSGTTSFSTLGVAVIILVGTALLLTNLWLDIIVGKLQKRFDLGDQRRIKWALDEKFQLQRLAYESAGMGEWMGGDDAVPVTRLGDRFGLPGSIDKDHPRLSLVPLMAQSVDMGQWGDTKYGGAQSPSQSRHTSGAFSISNPGSEWGGQSVGNVSHQVSSMDDWTFKNGVRASVRSLPMSPESEVGPYKNTRAPASIRSVSFSPDSESPSAMVNPAVASVRSIPPSYFSPTSTPSTAIHPAYRNPSASAGTGPVPESTSLLADQTSYKAPTSARRSMPYSFSPDSDFTSPNPARATIHSTPSYHSGFNSDYETTTNTAPTRVAAHPPAFTSYSAGGGGGGGSISAYSPLGQIPSGHGQLNYTKPVPGSGPDSGLLGDEMAGYTVEGVDLDHHN